MQYGSRSLKNYIIPAMVNNDESSAKYYFLCREYSVGGSLSYDNNGNQKTRGNSCGLLSSNLVEVPKIHEAFDKELSLMALTKVYYVKNNNDENEQRIIEQAFPFSLSKSPDGYNQFEIFTNTIRNCFQKLSDTDSQDKIFAEKFKDITFNSEESFQKYCLFSIFSTNEQNLIAQQKATKVFPTEKENLQYTCFYLFMESLESILNSFKVFIDLHSFFNLSYDINFADEILKKGQRNTDSGTLMENITYYGKLAFNNKPFFHNKYKIIEDFYDYFVKLSQDDQGNKDYSKLNNFDLLWNFLQENRNYKILLMKVLDMKNEFLKKIFSQNMIVNSKTNQEFSKMINQLLKKANDKKIFAYLLLNNFINEILICADLTKEDVQKKIIDIIEMMDVAWIDKSTKDQLKTTITNNQLIPLSNFIKKTLNALIIEPDIDEKFKNIATYILQDSGNIFLQCSDSSFQDKIKTMVKTKLNDDKMFSNGFLYFLFDQVNIDKNLIIVSNHNKKISLLQPDESILLKENNTFIINHPGHFNHLKKLKFWSDDGLEKEIKKYIETYVNTINPEI